MWIKNCFSAAIEYGLFNAFDIGNNQPLNKIWTVQSRFFLDVFYGVDKIVFL